jgi:hypothetical protein
MISVVSETRDRTGVAIRACAEQLRPAVIAAAVGDRMNCSVMTMPSE